MIGQYLCYIIVVACLRKVSHLGPDVIYLEEHVNYKTKPIAVWWCDVSGVLYEECTGWISVWTRKKLEESVELPYGAPHNQRLHQEIHFILFGADFWKSLWSRKNQRSSLRWGEKRKVRPNQQSFEEWANPCSAHSALSFFTMSSGRQVILRQQLSWYFHIMCSKWSNLFSK